MKLTGVGFILSVGHNSPEGVAHGHSYDCIAWYRFGHDARLLQRQVEVVRQKYDHTIVADELKLAENLAERIRSELPGCIEVECNRPLERLYAKEMSDAVR
jgi:hypothetical protein